MSPGNGEHPPRDPRQFDGLDTYPVAQVEALVERIDELEAENKALRDRVADLEAREKQAREDEAWAIREDVDVMSGHGEWTSQFWVSPADGWISETAPTIHAAIRALREKMENTKSKMGGVR